MPVSVKKKRVEFEVIASVAFVAVLNTIVFSSVSLSRDGSFNTWILSVTLSFFIYGGFVLVSIVAALLNKVTITKYAFLGLLTIITIRTFFSLYDLIMNPRVNDNGSLILLDAILIWVVNVTVFGLWYWAIDMGGPIARVEENDKTKSDILFPQHQVQDSKWVEWKPKFWDYMFFSFFSGTSFSPAYALPLSLRIKFLILLEVIISVIILVMVASRAINLL